MTQDDKDLIFSSYSINFTQTHIELNSSVILFLFLYFIIFYFENRDSHFQVDENIDIFKQLNYSIFEIHVVTISSSAVLFIPSNN